MGKGGMQWGVITVQSADTLAILSTKSAAARAFFEVARYVPI
jgi:hypothetical protein